MDGSVWPKVDGGSLDGGKQRCGEFVRVEAVLFQLNEAVGAGFELGKKSGERVGGERCGGFEEDGRTAG